MYMANVHVTLKRTVLDPQGVTVMGALKSLGFGTVGDVRVGKYFEISLDASSLEEARSLVEQMCRKLLTNPVIEDFSFEVIPDGGAAR